MTQIGASGHDAVPIGEVSAPPFARLPDPGRLFAQRADRFRQLAPGHPLAPYLTFLADLADVQQRVAGGLPVPQLPAPDDLARSREFGMPALDKRRFWDDPAGRQAVRSVLDGASAVAMPAGARAARDLVASLADDDLASVCLDVVEQSIPAEAVAEHLFVAMGLQVHAARTASRLDARALVPVGEAACPACGSPPTSTLVVGWDGAHGARFCSCWLCGTLWNFVRIRCVACGSTKGISYQELAGSDGAVKAECCHECRTFLKILHQTKDPFLDPVADDVASSALDLLVAETGLRRSGANPFLLGY